VAESVGATVGASPTVEERKPQPLLLFIAEQIDALAGAIEDRTGERSHCVGRLVGMTFWVLIAAASTASAQPIGTVTQGLTVGATPLATGEAAQRGLVSVVTSNPGGGAVSCSGVLLTNASVLTAGHCIDALQGSVTTVTATFATGTFTADAIYKFGGWSGDSTGPDIGLLRLSAPIQVNGSTTGIVTNLYAGDAKDKTITVYGASTGTYLKANMPVSSVQSRNLVLGASSAGVTTAPGDSGGPAFITENGQVFLAGMTSTTGPPALSSAIAPHRNWIIAATQTFLLQAQPSAGTAALLDEIQSIPEGDLLPASSFVLVDSSWAQAQRVVQWMCIKRGFIGGTFVPDLGGTPGQYRFACIGRFGGISRNALQSEINGTGQGFLDPDTVHWARGARVATSLCRQFLSGSIGGLFTGFKTTASGDPAQQMGVVCLGPAAGRFSDVNAGDLPVAGRDLDTLTWLGPRQDTSAFCRGFGHLGGFSTGEQAGAQRGVTCIGPTGIEQTPFGPVAAAPATLFQRHVDGRIWEYDGAGRCTATACPGWTEIDHNPRTEVIVAADPPRDDLH
jgi:V8-like Glu-specific endopeptidase